MKRLFLVLICLANLVACTPDPPGTTSTYAVQQYLSQKTGKNIQVFVESQKDTEGDFQNLQRELIVKFLLPNTADVPQVTLPNGLVLKRGVRSDSTRAIVVHTKRGQSWTTIKVELAKITK